MGGRGPTESAKRQCLSLSCTIRDGSHFLDFLSTARAKRWWLYPDALAMARAEAVSGTVRVDAADEKERGKESCRKVRDGRYQGGGPGGAERLLNVDVSGWDGSVVIIHDTQIKSTPLTPRSILTYSNQHEQFKLSRRE
jgi:hypothetical protein